MNRRAFKKPSFRRNRRQSSTGALVTEDERELDRELDREFDTVELDDVVRQVRNGRIDVAELDAF